MISKEAYKKLRTNFGNTSSWAIWAEAGEKPKSNTSDMSWVNDPNLLDKINTQYVFIGLNWSQGDLSNNGNIPWTNFHSGYSTQNDYKLRYALKGTKYWGSYITDVIKLYTEVDSNKVKNYLKDHPDERIKSLQILQDELSLLGTNLILVALGDEVYKILLNSDLRVKYKIIHTRHYSAAGGKEAYRKKLLVDLGELNESIN